MDRRQRQRFAVGDCDCENGNQKSEKNVFLPKLKNATDNADLVTGKEREHAGMRQWRQPGDGVKHQQGKVDHLKDRKPCNTDDCANRTLADCTADA